MKVDVVVDVGNSRIKWGRCTSEGVAAATVLPPDDPEAWEQALRDGGLRDSALVWAVSGVDPQCCDTLTDWLRRKTKRVWVLDSYRQLPLEVWVNAPEKVGIDRLLNAVAAVHCWSRRRLPAVLVDAGSAVTVDWVDEAGVFRGGAIFPGLRLMTRSLRDYTAMLPVVNVQRPSPYYPGRSTSQAIEAGVYYAAAGGINQIVEILHEQTKTRPHIFLTGGDASLLKAGVKEAAELWPQMTLEGVRLAADAQPEPEKEPQL